MRVKYSNDVKLTINEYTKSLKQYPISKERRNQKIRMLRNFMRNTIRTVCESVGNTSYPQCKFIDLGQKYGQNGVLLNPYLRQTHFADESGTQWLISFMLLEDNTTIFIQCLKQSRNVIRESVRITESQLRRIIQESIKKVLNII